MQPGTTRIREHIEHIIFRLAWDQSRARPGWAHGTGGARPRGPATSAQSHRRGTVCGVRSCGKSAKCKQDCRDLQDGFAHPAALASALAMHHLWLATRNGHKTVELREMLGRDFRLDDLSGHREIAEVVEDGATFAENAQLKAVAVSRQLPGLVLADDSGLEVDSLGGAPGIYSARYAGQEANDAKNREKLIAALAALGPAASRAARFRCALALARKGITIAMFEGTVEGVIVPEERGAAGFGYDPLFQPREFTKTFAELTLAEKNRLSHRAAAAAKLRDFLLSGPEGCHPA